MAFGLAEVLAIPPAISSTIELLRSLRVRLITQGTKVTETDDIEKQLKSILVKLHAFSNSRNELHVWKQIHHITNHISTDLAESFAILTRGRAEFVDRLDQYERRLILNEVRSLSRSGAPEPELRILLSKRALLTAAMVPASIYSGEMGWCEFLLDKIRLTSHHLRDGNYGSLYDELLSIQSLAINLNSYADDRLKEGIAEFCDVAERLSEAIGPMEA